MKSNETSIQSSRATIVDIVYIESKRRVYETREEKKTLELARFGRSKCSVSECSRV